MMRDLPGIRCGTAAAIQFIFIVIASSSATICRGDDTGPDESTSRKAAREENMRAMLERAQGTTIKSVNQTNRTEIVLIPKPLFHYTDEPRRIVDATLWGWTQSGRLVAVCKIEKYDHPPERTWLYCFGSLSTDLIDVKWIDGEPWTATKPGIEFRSIETDLPAAADLPGRLRQMKEMSNRFEARIVVDEKNQNTQQMRLLPRPIYRYEKSAGKIVDGAVFGLTTNGTNPDAVLIIELHETPSGKSQWMYGIAGMTAGGLSVKLNQKEIWTKPFVDNAGRYDNWLWFFGKPSIKQ